MCGLVLRYAEMGDAVACLFSAQLAAGGTKASLFRTPRRGAVRLVVFLP